MKRSLFAFVAVAASGLGSLSAQSAPATPRSQATDIVRFQRVAEELRRAGDEELADELMRAARRIASERGERARRVAGRPAQVEDVTEPKETPQPARSGKGATGEAKGGVSAMRRLPVLGHLFQRGEAQGHLVTPPQTPRARVSAPARRVATPTPPAAGGGSGATHHTHHHEVHHYFHGTMPSGAAPTPSAGGGNVRARQGGSGRGVAAPQVRAPLMAAPTPASPRSGAAAPTPPTPPGAAPRAARVRSEAGAVRSPSLPGARGIVRARTPGAAAAPNAPAQPRSERRVRAEPPSTPTAPPGAAPRQVGRAQGGVTQPRAGRVATQPPAGRPGAPKPEAQKPDALQKELDGLRQEVDELRGLLQRLRSQIRARSPN
jgi:hypothetical protein